MCHTARTSHAAAKHMDHHLLLTYVPYSPCRRLFGLVYKASVIGAPPPCHHLTRSRPNADRHARDRRYPTKSMGLRLLRNNGGDRAVFLRCAGWKAAASGILRRVRAIWGPRRAEGGLLGATAQRGSWSEPLGCCDVQRLLRAIIWGGCGGCGKYCLSYSFGGDACESASVHVAE